MEDEGFWVAGPCWRCGLAAEMFDEGFGQRVRAGDSGLQLTTEMRVVGEFFEKRFALREAGSSVGTELVAGLTTYLTLSYILFVQPAMLAEAGMDRRGVFVATCVASAFGCFLMGLLARYPIALAPAMGHNAFFTYTVVGLMGYRWQEALAANFIAGALFVVLSYFGLRGRVMRVLPEPLRWAIAAGIGLLIAFLGLQWGGLVAAHPATLVTKAPLGTPVALVSLFGLVVMSLLLVLRVPGALLLGMAATAAVAWSVGLIGFEGPFVQLPPWPEQTALKLDLAGLFTGGQSLSRTVAVVFVFLVLCLFDTVGTLVGVCGRAGLMKGSELPRAERALFSDAAATVVGTTLGTSTVTAYIESTAGIQAGGRTGLTAVTVGVLLLASLFFLPVVNMVGAGVPVDGASKYPVIAPVLILVGVFMATAVRQIRWDDLSEAIPAFLTIVVMQFSFSITDGMAWGFISYCVLKVAAGQGRGVPPLVYFLALLFVLHYVFLERLLAAGSF